MLVRKEINNILLKRKDGQTIEAQFKILDISYMDKIMKLQETIYNGLENKEFYFCSEREEFEEAIKGNGQIVGCISLENQELIAVGIYIEYGLNENNYGYDLEIEGEELLKVGQIEATVVLPEYRGNRLQKIMCEILENRALKSGIKYICATAAPNNKYSVNTLKNLNYQIKKDKQKYGGLRRYVFMKKLKFD